MSLRVLRGNGYTRPADQVLVWWDYTPEWIEDDDGDDGRFVDPAPDAVLTRELMNALVIEWLRGRPGPMGPIGDGRAMTDWPSEAGDADE